MKISRLDKFQLQRETWVRLVRTMGARTRILFWWISLRAVRRARHKLYAVFDCVCERCRLVYILKACVRDLKGALIYEQNERFFSMPHKHIRKRHIYVLGRTHTHTHTKSWSLSALKMRLTRRPVGKVRRRACGKGRGAAHTSLHTLKINPTNNKMRRRIHFRMRICTDCKLMTPRARSRPETNLRRPHTWGRRRFAPKAGN